MFIFLPGKYVLLICLFSYMKNILSNIKHIFLIICVAALNTKLDISYQSIYVKFIILENLLKKFILREPWMFYINIFLYLYLIKKLCYVFLLKYFKFRKRLINILFFI